MRLWKNYDLIIVNKIFNNINTCRAAPTATTSSGVILNKTSAELNVLDINCCNLGILHEPPARTT